MSLVSSMQNEINIINVHYTFLEKISGVNIVIADLSQGLCEIANTEKPNVLTFDGTPGEFKFFRTVVIDRNEDMYAALTRELERIPQPRVLLCHNFHFPLFFQEIVKPFIKGALRTGTQVINAIHDYSSNDTDTSGWLVDRGVSFTAVSEQLATDFRADGYHCAVVKNSINTQKFRPDEGEKQVIRNRLNIPEDAILIGSFARAVPRKQFPQLVSAFSKVAKRVKKKLMLLIRAIPSTVEPGRTDKIVGEIRDAITESGMEKSIILETNPVPWEISLAPYFNAADILVFPSINEGFGLQIPEAIATATPYISSDIGCYAEITENIFPDRREEILFTAGDGNAMVEAMSSAIDNLDIMKAGMAEARERVIEVYGLENMINGYMKLFRNAVRR